MNKYIVKQHCFFCLSGTLSTLQEALGEVNRRMMFIENVLQSKHSDGLVTGMASLFITVTLGGKDAHLGDEENETTGNEEPTRNIYKLGR